MPRPGASKIDLKWITNGQHLTKCNYMNPEVNLTNKASNSRLIIDNCIPCIKIT